MDTQSPLTPAQQEMADCWDRHTAAEFAQHDLDATLATMTAEPFVNHVAVRTGGMGRAEVKRFYGTWFIPCQPADTQIVHVSRTVGENRLVDELIHKFTHTVDMPWILPGVPPTGRRVEVAVIVVVEFQDGMIAGERIYWDQASVLAQVGLLDPAKLPIWGAEVAHQLLEPARPHNELITRRM